MTLTKKILPLAAIVALALPGTALARGPKAKLQFSTAAYAVAEDGGSATITVYRQGNAKRVNQAATVDYATSDGTAQAGVDYTAEHGTLSFASGETSKTFTVPVINKDNINTGPRTVNLKLSHPTADNGAVLGYPSTATLVISDDDSSNGGGGTTAPTFQLAAASDMVSEPTSGTATETLYIIRSGDLSTPASVSYSTTDGTAISGTDYTGVSSTTLSFPSQSTDPVSSIIQAVPITLLHDPASTDPIRSFTFDLAAVNGSTLGTPSSERVDIVNGDGNPTVQWAAPSYTVNENDGSVRLTAFVAGNVTAEVDANYATADGSAIAGVNYTAQADQFQFMPGDAGVAQSFDVPVMSDGQLGDKFFTAGLSGLAGTIGTPDTTTVTILNSDQAPAAGGTTGGTTGGDNGTTGTTGTAGQDQGGQLVLGARQGACGLTIKAAKKQRLLKQKGLKLTLRAGQSCKVSLTTLIKKAAAKKHNSAKSARALRFKGKNASLTLQPGKAKTVKVTFTKKTLKAITEALRARNQLVATITVTTRDSASKVTRKTLKITIRR